MLKFIFLTALVAFPAFADDGHFPAAPHVAPVVGAPVAGQAPGDCSNKAALSKYLTDLRFSLRKEYAGRVAQAIPHLGLQSPVNGVSCIKSTEAFDAAYNNPPDDSFTLTCLAHSRVAMNGRMEDVFSHILQLKLKADPSCLAVANINNFVAGTQCLIPGGLQQFTQGMRNCMGGLERDTAAGLAPQFMTSPVAYSIDGAWYGELLQHKPSVGNIIDVDRRIKGAASSPIPAAHGSGGASSTSSSDDEECSRNPFNCSSVPAK
jgi:hypothetical protein